MPRARRPCTSSCAGGRSTGLGYWAVEFDGKVVGVAGVRPLVFRERECWNLYYWFAPDGWGKGLAAEAAGEAAAVAEAQRPRPAGRGSDPSCQSPSYAGSRESRPHSTTRP